MDTAPFTERLTTEIAPDEAREATEMAGGTTPDFTQGEGTGLTGEKKLRGKERIGERELTMDVGADESEFKMILGESIDGGGDKFSIDAQRMFLAFIYEEELFFIV